MNEKMQIKINTNLFFMKAFMGTEGEENEKNNKK